MVSSLISSLIGIPRREVSGSDTASRFDYQKDWAFYEAIERHIDDTDYLIAFEFHEDVLIFQSENSPNSVEFVQVKTKSGSKCRTISDLTKSKVGSDSEIVKLIKSADPFAANYNVTMVMVSNNAFSFSDNDVHGESLKEEHKKKLIDAIKKEAPEIDASKIDKMHFRVTNIPINKIQTMLNGKACELFEKKFGADFKANVTSWVRLIQGEIKRKNNFNPNLINLESEFFDKKCIGKTFIDQTLERAEKSQSPPNLDWVFNQLSTSWGFNKIQKIRNCVARAFSDFKDPTNDECQNFVEDVKNARALIKTNSNISELLDGIYNELSKSGKLIFPYDDEYYVLCLSLLVIHEEN